MLILTEDELTLVLNALDLEKQTQRDNWPNHFLAFVERVIAKVQAAKDGDAVWHCNICGGTVDHSNSTKPTVQVGPGRR